MEIRIANKEDAAELLEIYRPYIEDTAITFEYEVPSVEEFSQRIENTLKKYPYIVAVEGNEIVGYAYLSAFKSRAAYDWSVETSIYVKQGCVQKGIGKALYDKLEEIGKRMNLTNFNACIASPIEVDEHLDNNSVQFHEHVGYQLVGRFHDCAYKFNTWYDMVWMEKMIMEHKEKPGDIHWFDESIF